MPEPLIDALTVALSGLCRSRWLFGALFKLLFERGELGERRIGIRLLVTSAGPAAKRLGIILLAFGTIDPVLTVATRALPARTPVLPFVAIDLPLRPLLTLDAVLAFLAIRPVAALMARPLLGVRRLRTIRRNGSDTATPSGGVVAAAAEFARHGLTADEVACAGDAACARSGRPAATLQ